MFPFCKIFVLMKLFNPKLNYLACALSLTLGLSACSTQAPWQIADANHWQKLNTVAYKGKQDDIYFIDSQQGWYGNGAGKLYHTQDGGENWQEIWSQPGTFIRALGFIDEQRGFLGNIGTDYFPGVSDEQALYQTKDGGKSWTKVMTADGQLVKGICAIDILRNNFINSGIMDQRLIIHAAGRVGGPAHLMRSLNGGESWSVIDLSAHTAMILDVKFFDAMTGLVFGASDADTEKSHARIIMTRDGGKTWRTVYESKRLHELTWKASFPSRNVGYVTIQSYDPNPQNQQRYVAKTEDGGLSWREINLVSDHKVREFGVGFVDERNGWVGALDGGYQTTDGGNSWRHVAMGRAVNKIRIIKNEQGVLAYAIGSQVYKFKQDHK